MNLYGENGNISALKRFIERQGVQVKIDRLTLGDKIDFEAYDFYYMGSGIEESMDLVLADLYNYKDDIKTSIENGKMYLITGNAMNLFGRKMKLKNGKNVDCLGIFDYNATCSNTRLVGEIYYEFPTLPEGKGRNLIGFKNTDFNIVNNDGCRPFGPQDNINYKNFFAMSFFGPVLIRNPYFTDYLLNILFESKNLEYKEDDEAIEYKAYHQFVKNFIENANLD